MRSARPLDRWDFHRQYDYDRLQSDRQQQPFVIVPNWHRPNLGSKILSLCQKRLSEYWQERFGHPLLLLETFVDPKRFQGTDYRAANWTYLGLTRAYRRTRQGYSGQSLSPEKVFHAFANPCSLAIRLSRTPITLSSRSPKNDAKRPTDEIVADFFIDIPDPRRAQGPQCMKRLPCRRVNGRYLVPCESIIRDVVIRVDPVALNQPLTD